MIKKTQRRYPLTAFKTLYTEKFENLDNCRCTFEVVLGIVDEFNPELYYEYDKLYEEYDYLLSVKEETDIIKKYIGDYTGQYLQWIKLMTPEMLKYENLLNNFNKKDLHWSEKISNFVSQRKN